MRKLKIGVFYIVEYNKGEGYLTQDGCILPKGRLIPEIDGFEITKHIFEDSLEAYHIIKDYLYYHKECKKSQFKIVKIDLSKVAFNNKSKGVISVVKLW